MKTMVVARDYERYPKEGVLANRGMYCCHLLERNNRRLYARRRVGVVWDIDKLVRSG